MASDSDFVTWGRWEASHQALRDHMDELVEPLAARITVLEGLVSKRGDRRWTVILAVLSGLILPLVAAAVIAVITVLGH